MGAIAYQCCTETTPQILKKQVKTIKKNEVINEKKSQKVENSLSLKRQQIKQVSNSIQNTKQSKSPPMQVSILDQAKIYGQQHLVQHYQSLKDPKLKEQFLSQLKGIDFAQTNSLFKHVYLQSKQSKQQQRTVFQPVKNVCSAADLLNYFSQFNQIGLETIANGQVGVLIMSGGQGTRLGFDHPKGMFNLGLHSKLTLFGFFAHRLIRLMNLAKQKYPNSILNDKNMIKWYIMTSQMNHQQVCTYFKQNNYFGYHSQSIIFFPQGGIPAVAYDGKIVIESQGNISLAPGGNGAIYTEMKNRGVLTHMEKHNIKYINLGPVDNVLLKVADPISLGYMVKNNFQIVSHYILKRNPQEKVGLHVNVNGAVRICEYSQVSKQVTELKDTQGNLVYCHGARATMYVSRNFIERITSDQKIIEKINKKYHLAEKKIKYFDIKTKNIVKPQKNNGVKFELFYFDVFEQAKRFGLFQTLREEEFSPLKNANGEDSPQSARIMLRALNKKWVQKSGVKIQGEGVVQIDPIVSYNGEGIKQWIQKKYGSTSVKLPLYIQ